MLICYCNHESRKTPSWAIFTSYAVLRPSEAVWHAGQTSAGLHLPSSRTTEEGAPFHHHPAQLLGLALGHQDLQGCHCFPHDGNLSLSVCVATKSCAPCSLVVRFPLPLQVLALVFIRKLLDFIFTKRELSWLDDLMPEWKKKKLEDAAQEVQGYTAVLEHKYFTFL